MTVAIPEQTVSGQIAIAGRQLDDWIPVLREVVYLAEQIADSPFVPTGLRGSVPAVAAAILAGRELDIPPMTALANIHVISGKTGLSALLMRGLIQSRGHDWEDVEVTDTRVVVRGRRKGKAEWTTASFNAAQAQAAKIALHPYPQDKLYARASVRLARRIFADVIMGMPYSAEELEDGELDEQTATTEQPAEQPKPRTAQRRTPKTQDRDGARGPVASQPGIAVEAAAGTDQPAAAGNDPSGSRPGPDLPPLPGEEADFDTPGTVTGPQLTKIAVLMGELGFTKDQRDDKLKTASRVARRDLASSKELSKNEASALIDTIENCGADWDKLQALLDAGDKPGGESGE